MLNLRELQEMRKIQEDRKAFTDRYGMDEPLQNNNNNNSLAKQALSAWDPITNKPQVLILNNGTDPIVLDNNTPRQDITKNIVFQKGFPFSQNQSQIIPRPTPQIEYSQIKNIQQPLPQNFMHENHHRERPYQLKSVEEILRPWKAKEIMYTRQINSLQDQINRGAFTISDSRTIRVDNVSKKMELENEVSKLEAILKNKDEEIMRLKIQSQELETQFQELESDDSASLEKYKKELDDMKKRFKDMNNKYHECQEECTMKETEIESFKKSKIQVVKSQTVQSKVVNKSAMPLKNLDSPNARISTVSDKDSDYY